ncbi:MAG: TonB-dependent receptor [Ferruginibacter sp.]|nr:TonB-dependent receptor [Ferruginibacter sp.]
MKKKFLLVAAVIISSQLYAQRDSTKQLDDVVFTANKYPQKQSSTGKVLTVIDRAQLENNTGRTIAQVLNEQAGLIINGSQNPLGSNQTIYLRGAGSANTLILVDGVPANDASGISGEFDLNQFSIDQVERIEILKGAQSVLYGSDAVAGVINIITKKQTGNRKVTLNASAAGGTYGTFKGTAGVSGKLNAFSYNLRYTRLQSKGFSAAQDVDANKNFDKDGYEHDVLGMNLTAQAAKNWKLNFFSQLGEYRTDLDDASFTDDKNSRAENKNLQAGISSLYNFNKGSFTVNLNLNNIKRILKDEKNIPADPNDFDPFNGLYKGRSVFAETFTNLNLTDHVGLLAGADLRNQNADIETTYGKLGDDSLHATQVSGYASFFLKSLAGFNAELGGRITNHSKFGAAFTYSFNPSYIINKEVKLFANIASGFRAPTLYNLASEYGNIELEPERSTSLEAGVQYINLKNTINLRVVYFNRIIKDVIIFRSLFVAPYGKYYNADKQKGNGFEVEATIRPADRWNITANYAFVDGSVETKSGATGKDTSIYNLFRRPKNALNVTVGFQPCKKFFVSAGTRWVDKRDDLYFNPNTFASERKELKAYYNLDLYASYQPVKAVKIFADLRNVTNQLYFDQFGYNNRRFNVMAGVVVMFE